VAESNITVRFDIEAADEALARLEQRARNVEKRVALAIMRLQRAEDQLASPRNQQEDR